MSRRLCGHSRNDIEVRFFVWYFFIAAAGLVALLASIYLWTRFRKFVIVQRLSGGNKWLAALLSALPVIVLIIWAKYDPVNAVTAGVHLAFFWMASDALGWVIRQIRAARSVGERDHILNAEDSSGPGKKPDDLQKDPLQEAMLQKEMLQKKPLQKQPLQKAMLQEEPLQEEPLQKAMLQEEPLQKELLQEETLQKKPLQKEPLQKAMLQEEPLQKQNAGIQGRAGTHSPALEIQPRRQHIYWQGILALAVTVVYLGIGVYLDYNVWETDYTIFTEKDLGMETLRVVQISDSHLGTTFGGEGFAKHLARIQETKPDLVVLTGDYVDDDSTREDMIRSSQALGEINATYGVYFIFGNHDEGYFHYRDFTGREMVEELEKNGVVVLEDETVQITDRINLIGRKDRSVPERLSAAQLMENLDPSCYNILLDHQPHDFNNEAEAGFDLVLCGHTHGGQMFPVGITGELSGANDKTYGLEQRKDTVFIVNSGISDWAFKFKTATRSEFGVIDIQSAPEKSDKSVKSQ